MKKYVIDKIKSRHFEVGVIGLGYVGLPLAVRFAEKRFEVLGVDTDRRKVRMLGRGKSYIEDVDDQRIADLGIFEFMATSNYGLLDSVNAIIICVPTPLDEDGKPNLSYITGVVDELMQIDLAGKLIVLESTTYPGTTEEILVERMRNAGYRVGVDCFVAFSPERVDPGRVDFTIANTPKVVGGVTPDCLDVAVALYGEIVDEVVPVSSTRVAEMAKIWENTFRAVNIALANELAMACDNLGIDPWEVVNAAATKPYGFMPFYPGPGPGGHCIPVDPVYLSWKMRGLNTKMRLVDTAMYINSRMPRYIVDKVENVILESGQFVLGSPVMVIGVAYKPNIGDTRESPALEIIRVLRQMGAHIAYHDPYVEEINVDGHVMHSGELSWVKRCVCVVIVTDHDLIDWEYVYHNSKLIVDTRNIIGKVKHGIEN